MTPALESSVSAPWLIISRLIPMHRRHVHPFLAVASQVARASPASAAALPSGPSCAIVPISMLIWLASDPSGVELRFHLMEERRIRVGRVLREMAVLELDVADAVRVHVVLRQIEQGHRLSRRGIRGPRRLHDAPVIEGHDRDARELRGRDICRSSSATAATALPALPAGGCPAGAGCLALSETDPAAPTMPAVPTRNSLRFIRWLHRSFRWGPHPSRNVGGTVFVVRDAGSEPFLDTRQASGSALIIVRSAARAKRVATSWA